MGSLLPLHQPPERLRLTKRIRRFERDLRLEVLTPEYFIHHTPDEVHVLVSDLDKD
jgi:hypothetical protein